MVFAFYRQNDTVSHFKRDVSQITHILEIWDFGGENNIEKKKKLGLFTELAIGKENFSLIV